MFRASLCPSSGALDRILLHTVISSCCAGWCLGKPGSRPCAHSAHGTPYAVIYGLAVLKMGIMMPETF